MRLAPFLCSCSLAVLVACAPSMTTAPVTAEIARQHAQLATLTSQSELGLPAEGLASWYGPGFAGRRTANGEIFDPALLTAAHKSLPFGTRLRVTNLGNSQSVIVRINDRGPFRPGRIIDLSRAAAARLRMVGSGVARVRIELLTVSGTPAWAALASNELRGFGIISRFHPRGQLLYLTSAAVSEPLLVRVVGNDIPPGVAADLLLSPEAFALLGSRITAVRGP